MKKKKVPNYDSFLPVVRCVRKWAKARGLYSNKMGYLGGVNFNIMVAFASQVGEGWVGGVGGGVTRFRLPDFRK